MQLRIYQQHYINNAGRARDKLRAELTNGQRYRVGFGMMNVK